MANVSTLEEAAMSGDINSLYEVIQQDPRILEDVDAKPFVDTPMHIAARAGHLEFAIEIMTLKPSLALKLNQQGFSPIHIALQNNHHYLVKRLVCINIDLVRVKGREGLTPLHFLCQSEENIELLIFFLDVCPDSIKDLNARGETALHIALRYEKFRALRVLVGWLHRNTRKGARLLQRYVLGGKDLAGNTILHLSTLAGNRQAVDLLIDGRWIPINAKNLEGKTALDLAGASAEIQRILLNAGAKDGASVPDLNYEDELTSKITVPQKIITFMHRIRSSISIEQRDVYMVVAALIISAIYQSALSPPGGLYQAEADNGANNMTTNATSSLNFTATAAPGNAGTSILPAPDFVTITVLNTWILVWTLMTIIFLMPSGWVGPFLVAPIIFFATSYLYSVAFISPTSGIGIAFFTAAFFISVYFAWVLREIMLPPANHIDYYKALL